ncbi:MAG: iron-sulfur cluster assembly accessory protein [Mariprofundaceae bacterium]|nr:iron-sulfur cluster assembly accessory protein [Mariprofundaceae bacterium]
MSDIDISLSDAACEQLKNSLLSAGKKAVHLSVREAGCSGLEYVMDYADEPLDDDLVREFDGFSLYVDKDSYAKALAGLQVDYQKDALSSAFVYHNPNKKGECGCGVSFTI